MSHSEGFVLDFALMDSHSHPAKDLCISCFPTADDGVVKDKLHYFLDIQVIGNMMNG